MDEAYIKKLATTRLKLCSHIARYNLMIKRGYHPEFFQELANKTIRAQRHLLKIERSFASKK